MAQHEAWQQQIPNFNHGNGLPQITAEGENGRPEARGIASEGSHSDSKMIRRVQQNGLCHQQAAPACIMQIKKLEDKMSKLEQKLDSVLKDNSDERV